MFLWQWHRLAGRLLAWWLLVLLVAGCTQMVRPSAPEAEKAPPGALERPSLILADVAFQSDLTGYGVTHEGSIVRTEDSGKTWHPAALFERVAFTQILSAGSAFIAVGRTGCDTEPYCQGKNVLAATEDGQAWTLITLTSFAEQSLQNGFIWLRFSFPTEQIGYATLDPDMIGGFGPIKLAQGGLLVSTDGGRTWAPRSLPDGYLARGGLHFRTVQSGLITAVKGAASVILATDDGGLSWQEVYTTEAFPLYAVYMADEQNGFAGGGHVAKFSQTPRQVVLATEDGGESWAPVYQSEEAGQPIDGLRFTSPSGGYATTGVCTMGANMPCAGPLLVTQNGGKIWRAVPYAERVDRFSAAGTSAWLLDQLQAETVVRRTRDGGAGWSVIYP